MKELEDLLLTDSSRVTKLAKNASQIVNKTLESNFFFSKDD